LKLCWADEDRGDDDFHREGRRVKARFTTFIESITPPEKFVVLILLFLGGIASLAIPLSAGYDEETHFIRAWEMAHFYFIPNDQPGAKLPFPAIYWDLSYRRQPIVEAVEPGFWGKYSGLPLDAYDYVYSNVETRSVYSPALLFPQALTLRYLGLSLGLPALPVYYACRMAGLLSYLLLGWLAVRFIPYGKWLLAILVCAPMAIFQASAVSADTISNGIGFLFLGGTLAIANRNEISRREWSWLLALIALLFLAKVNLIFLALLPFLLIPRSKFTMKYGYGLLAAAALALFLVEVGGWNILAYSRFTRALEGADPRQQVLFILSSPLQFVKIILLDAWNSAPAYFTGWVGVYGYDYWPVPGLVYLLYPLSVAASLLRTDEGQDQAPPRPATRRRRILALLFVAGYVLTITSLYVAFTPVKSSFVAGVQGRYFTPVAPLLLLALAGSPLASKFRVPATIPVALAGLGLALYIGGLILSYHVPCGSEYYRFSLCYQPVYKNWAPESASSPAVSPAMTLTQEFVPACNGMKELRVWVNSRGNPNGTTELTLVSSDPDRHVAQQTFLNADIRGDDWLRMQLSPDWQSMGKVYRLVIQGSSPDGMTVGYSLKPEYALGKLYENNVRTGKDVLFQYGCIAGLQKLSQTPKR
jgi:predicted membrane protein DUF2142